MKEKFLIWLGDFITKFRYLFLVLFIGLFVIGLINLNNVKINDSITDYLPAKTETKTGLKLMEEEYGTLVSVNVMLKDIEQNEALDYYNKFKSIKDIDAVMFENNESYYKDNNALYKIQLVGKTDKEIDQVVKEIKNITKEQDTYIYSDEFEDPTKGVTLVLILCIAIILVVLLITAKTYFEPVIAFIIFAICIVLNMGSNFIFNEISYITKAIAVVLQLALSIDYVIIFMNQYMKEISDTDDKILAIKKTLSKSISEICSSSLTTIAGLIALVFMQLRIGGDIGLVLSKGILCSLLTVIFIMPCLLDMFKTPIVKLKKKDKKNVNSLLATSTKYIAKYKFVLLPIYIILIVIAVAIIPFYHYVFDLNTIKAVNVSDNIKSLNKQEEVFGKDNTIIILFENKDKVFNKELLMAQDLKNVKGVNNVTSIGSYELTSNLYLGTKLSYQQVALLFNLEPDQVMGLYQLYALNNNELDKAITIDNYQISIIDLINFIYAKQDELPLDSNAKLMINMYANKLNESYSFLESANYTRIVLTIEKNR